MIGVSASVAIMTLGFTIVTLWSCMGVALWVSA